MTANRAATNRFSVLTRGGAETAVSTAGQEAVRLDLPTGLRRDQDHAGGTAIGARSASGTRIEHPRKRVAIVGHPMAVAVADRPRMRKTGAQPLVASSGRDPMTV